MAIERALTEHAPIKKLAKGGGLFTYKDKGFWQCMDTAWELQYLEWLWKTNNVPWKNW